MENNSQKLNGFNSCFTGDYLHTLLHGPYNSSAMDIELQKINAHVVQEETLMRNIAASVGVTILLAVMAYLFYFPVPM